MPALNFNLICTSLTLEVNSPTILQRIINYKLSDYFYELLQILLHHSNNFYIYHFMIFALLLSLNNQHEVLIKIQCAV